MSVQAKRRLTAKEMIQFVSDVVNSVVVGPDGEYRPELKDYLIRLSAIDMYTNITLPKSIETCYKLVYGTNVFDTLVNLHNIDMEQYEAMIAAIDDKIAHKLAQRSKWNIVADEVIDFLQQATSLDEVNLKDVIEKIGGMANIDEKTLVDAIVDKMPAGDGKVIPMPSQGKE